MKTAHARPEFFELHNGSKAPLPFPASEYQTRLSSLRRLMEKYKLSAVLLTSMHNIAYYTGFLYCSFGRPYACVVTDTDCTTVSANIDLSQPWRRSYGDNVIYTDWKRDNYWRAIRYLVGKSQRNPVMDDRRPLADRADLFRDRFEPIGRKDLVEMLARDVAPPERIDEFAGPECHDRGEDNPPGAAKNGFVRLLADRPGRAVPDPVSDLLDQRIHRKKDVASYGDYVCFGWLPGGSGMVYG